MFATAHIVRSARNEEAVHAFLHLHGPVEWPRNVVDWPEAHPGKLVSSSTVLPLGGNRVRAYLDVLAPDEAPWGEVRTALQELAADLVDQADPVAIRSGRVTLRFGAEASLADRRARVLQDLAAAVERLFAARSMPGPGSGTSS